MAGHYQILLPLLSLFVVRVDLTDLFPLHLPVEILKVYDGDTLMVGHGSYKIKVRLSRIDSPENGQPFLKNSADAGAFSGKCLSKLLHDKKTLILKMEKQDIYGRTLGDVNDVSFELVRFGCTSLYPHAVFSSKSEKQQYLSALKKAKAQKLGLWQYGGIMQPKVWRRLSKRSAHRR